MKTLSALTASSLLATLSAAAPSPENVASAADNVPDGVVVWDIERRAFPEGYGPLRRRDGQVGSTYEEVITNEKLRGGYFATTKVGTPGQNLMLQLDTGSSDIWVPYTGAEVCQKATRQSNGCSFGAFDYTKSSSFVDVGKGLFKIKYVDGSHSNGDYISETFEIGGAIIPNVTMGIGLDTDIPYGLVGVGYALNEAIVGGSRTGGSAYPNLPVVMMNEGLIKTNAYSLWLNDLDANTGNILFGGIDTEKYKGDLSRVQVYQDPNTGAFTSFIVAMTSMTAMSPSGTDQLTSRQFPIPVVLDSGTTLSYLPTDLATQIWKETGAFYTDDIGLAVIPCSMAKSKGSFSFGFAGPNGPRINVTMDELVLPLSDPPAKFQTGPYRGQDACEFGIQNSSSDPFLLGDTFLRSAYVVYDLINNEIGIAPTDFNSTKTNIVAFPSQGATIPSATVVANQAAATVIPSIPSPTFGAAAGFTEGVGNAAPSLMGKAMGREQIIVVGLTMALTAVGGGFFALF